MKKIPVDEELTGPVAELFRSMPDVLWRVSKIEAVDEAAFTYVSVGSEFVGKLRLVNIGGSAVLVVGDFPFGGMHTSAISSAERGIPLHKKRGRPSTPPILIHTKNSLYEITRVKKSRNSS